MSFFNRKKDEVNTSIISKTINWTYADTDLDSSLVWDAWYNAPEQTAYVNLEGTVYAYTNVPESDYRDLVNSYSVGSAFSRFKRRFGPSEKLGVENTLSKIEIVVPQAAPGVVPKNLTYAPDATIATAEAPAPAPYISLRAAEPVEAEKRTHTVHFESNGSKTYSLEAVSVDAAVAALNELTEMLGISVKVTGVFVHIG